MAPNKAGRAVAKALAIDLDYRQRHEPKDAVQSAADSFQSIEVYEEREPTVGEVLRHLVPNKKNTLGYIRSLFPFWSWIFHYNWTWMIGDIIAVSTCPLPGHSKYHPLAKTDERLWRCCARGVILNSHPAGLRVRPGTAWHSTWQRPSGDRRAAAVLSSRGSAVDPWLAAASPQYEAFSVG